MVLGMSLHTFTLLHVVICFVELLAGAIAVVQLLGGKVSGLTSLYLVSAFLTALTGFMFPFHGWTPGDTLGVLSLLATAFAALALYAFHLAGGWRKTYAISALVLLYFDAFVGVVQAFQKIGPLHVLAPKGTGLPFAIAQGAVLAIFVFAGILAVKRFKTPAVA